VFSSNIEGRQRIIGTAAGNVTSRYTRELRSLLLPEKELSEISVLWLQIEEE
jgi:hypothetical protein